MLRVISAGFLGGLVLFAWSVVFSVVGPVDESSPATPLSAATIGALRARVAAFELPFGPAAASAAGGQAPVATQKAMPPIDLAALGGSLATACAAACFAAVLMSWFGGAKKPFAERVVFSVVLGGFAALSMSVPAGAWTEFSMHRTTMLLGELVVGWLLAGMVIAVVLNPRARRARA